MNRLFLVLFAALHGHLMVAQTDAPGKIKLPEELPEVSGLYYASQDSLWWHNDSGDQPRLILTDETGTLLHELKLPIQHKDWEDITTDDRGNIYIGDFGNNANARQDLRIYIMNPRTQALDSILFTYPDQVAFPPPSPRANFDMEGFFWFRDSLHLFSKNRLRAGNGFTKHYVLPARAGRYTAELRDSIYLPDRVVTAAAISPDGQTVALLSYFYNRILNFIPKSRTTIWTFSNFEGTAFFRGDLSKKAVRNGPAPSQFESIDFIDNQRVYVASERVPFYKQQAKLVKLKKVKRVNKP